MNDAKVTSIALVAPSIRTMVLQVWTDGDRFETDRYHVLAIVSQLYDNGEVVSRSLIGHRALDCDEILDTRDLSWPNSLEWIVVCPWPVDQDDKRFQVSFGVMKAQLRHRLERCRAAPETEVVG